jgi:hypothetical protein
MSKSTLGVLCAAVIGSLAMSPLLASPKDVVACELFRQSDLSSAVRSTLERKTTAPESRLSYGATRSVCGYHDGLHYWATVHVAEFPSSEKAAGDYVEQTKQRAHPTDAADPIVVKPQSGIGERASWLEYPSHSGVKYMYVVLKGKFVFDVGVHGKYHEGSVLMERLRPLVQEAAGRL